MTPALRVTDRHDAVLITRREDGWPQASPVTLGVDDGDRLVIASYPSRAKAKNLRRESAATVCVLSDDFGGEAGIREFLETHLPA